MDKFLRGKLNLDMSIKDISLAEEGRSGTDWQLARGRKISNRGNRVLLCQGSSRDAAVTPAEAEDR